MRRMIVVDQRVLRMPSALVLKQDMGELDQMLNVSSENGVTGCKVRFHVSMRNTRI